MSSILTTQDPPGRFDDQEGPLSDAGVVSDLARRARACDDGLISVDPVLVAQIIADLEAACDRVDVLESQQARVRDAIRDSALHIQGLSLVPVAVIRTALRGER